MAINAEWIINKAKEKIYAVSHAKAVVRGDSTVDADLTALEDSLTFLRGLVAPANIWTQSNITDTVAYTFVYANNLWVAGTYGYGLYYSTDGKTWTQSNITDNSIKLVIYANNLWVAGNGVAPYGLYYSTNGKTWTQSTTSFSNPIDQIYYINSTWFAAGDKLYYSTDGKAWTGAYSYETDCLAYGNNVYVIGRNSSSYGIYYGSSYKSFTASNLTGKYISDIVYENGIFIAVTLSGYGLYYSTDGKTWTQSNITDKYMRHVRYFDTFWIAAGSATDTIGLYYSTDGKAWTEGSISGLSTISKPSFQDVCYYKQGFIAFGGSGVFNSKDGKTWTQSLHSAQTSDNYSQLSCISTDGDIIVGAPSILRTGIYYS